MFRHTHTESCARRVPMFNGQGAVEQFRFRGRTLRPPQGLVCETAVGPLKELWHMALR